MCIQPTRKQSQRGVDNARLRGVECNFSANVGRRDASSINLPNAAFPDGNRLCADIKTGRGIVRDLMFEFGILQCTKHDAIATRHFMRIFFFGGRIRNFRSLTKTVGSTCVNNRTVLPQKYKEQPVPLEIK